jgi:hypothetical protein
MILRLVRTHFTENETIGELYVDNEFECYTLEDVVRPDGTKIYGATAIPSGTYDITITYSPRFGKYLPLLLNVPNFSGVRIHSGNTHRDTEGCILVGSKKTQNSVLESRKAFATLYNKLLQSPKNGEGIKIVIE